MNSPIVFFDIAGPGDRNLRRFYEEIFGWSISDAGQFSVEVVSPLEGAIREDPAEKRIYIGVESVTESLNRIQKNGGVIDAARFDVPGVAILGLFTDPAGNEMGLVEVRDGEPRIP